MIGAIRTWDVVSHPLVTAQCFGWTTLIRVMLAGRKQTFLSLLSNNALMLPADAEATAILKQCIDLELRAEDIYVTLAGATIEEPALTLFFTTLAQQEQSHADLLRLCAVASKQDEPWLKVLRSWRDEVIRLDGEMRKAEALVSSVGDVDDAMRLVVQVESSEVNRIFLAAMSASGSPFVKRLRPFQKAVETHIRYIASELPKLAPDLCCEADDEEEYCGCMAECGTG
jgi:rubrerythrin